MNGAAAGAPADRAARQAAQSEFQRPFALEAGAGTGKTTALVARALVWCLGPGWEKARLRLAGAGAPAAGRLAARVLQGTLAITFTEAAAAEMADRMARELARLSRGEEAPPWLETGLIPSAPERTARAGALLGALDCLAVRTIHAFCLGLLTGDPLAAGVHPRLTVDAEGDLLEGTVREVVELALREGYGDPGDPALLALAAAGFGPEEVVQALLVLAAAAVPAATLREDPFGAARLSALRARLAEALERLRGPLAAAFEGGRQRSNARLLAERLGSLAGRLRGTEPASVADLQGWAEAELAANLRAHLKAWAKGNFGQAERRLLGEAVCAEAEVRAAESWRLLDHLRQLDVARFTTARQALAPLLAAVEDALRRRGIITFDALLGQAFALLRDHADVRDRVGRSIDQLLVDEFQDTDQMQCEILGLLAFSGPAGERPGLFLVGDPKQSIYGWRRADLAAYDSFLTRLRSAGGEVRALSVNFRSAPAILAEVAGCVEPVMVAEPGLQPAFEALLPCAELASAGGFLRGGRRPVEHWVSWAPGDGPEEPGPATSETASEIEAAAVARDLRRLHDEHGVLWEQAAILLRSTGNLEIYLEALRRAGVPFRVANDRHYFRRREVIEAAALVRTVLDPGDHLALLTTLRSLPVGVPDAALVPLWSRGFPGQMTELASPDPLGLAALRRTISEAAAALPGGVPGLERVQGWELNLAAAVENLAMLRDTFRWAPADLFIERLRRVFALEATAAACDLGVYRLANLDRFFRRLAVALDEERGDVPAVLRALRVGVSEARDAEEGRPPQDLGGAVAVLTIHGAKGLDFEHVYLPQLHRQPPPPSAAAAAAVGVTSREGSGPHDAGRLPGRRFELRLFGAPSLAWYQVEGERARVEAAERVRLLYVAMTRAKSRLVLAGNWPRATGATAPGRCRTLLELLHWRPGRPDLVALWRELAGRHASAVPAPAWRVSEDGAIAPEREILLPGALDEAGALWRFPALEGEQRTEGWLGGSSGQAGGALVAAPGPASAVIPDVLAASRGGPDGAEAAAALLRFAGLRSSARERMARSVSGAASEEAHAALRELQAERLGGEDGGPVAAALPAGEGGHRDAADAAMAAGAAFHRALETWDFAADPGAEMPRQRAMMPAYVAAVLRPPRRPGNDRRRADRGDAPIQPAAEPAANLAEVALARALALLDRFADSGLLARLCGLAGRILARELPLLAEPSSPAGGAGPVSFLSGVIDLLYRDEDGSLVVADYKTDEVKEADEVSRRAAAYAKQGAVYVRAVRQALGLARQPRFELWLVRTGRVLPVDLGE